jgi:hypothetical protein
MGRFGGAEFTVVIGIPLEYGRPADRGVLGILGRGEN